MLAALALLAAGSYFAYQRLGRKPVLPEGLLQANGRIEGDTVVVASKFAGRISKLLAREGDSVREGDVIVQLDDAQIRARLGEAQHAIPVLETRIGSAKTAVALLRRQVPLEVDAAAAGVAQAKAMISKAEAAEDQARRDADRFQTLAQRGTIGKQRGEQAELAATAAARDLEAAREQLVQAEKKLAVANLGWEQVHVREQDIGTLDAQLQQVHAALVEPETVLHDLQVVAPISGMVATRVRDVGEVVGAGGPVLTLVDLDRLYLKVYVPESEIGKLRLGLPARIYTDAFPDTPFEATVRYIASNAEFTPKEVQTQDERVKLVYAVKLYFTANPSHRLTPGLPADAIIQWKEGASWAKPLQ
jgi:HlyD family secretion protein